MSELTEEEREKEFKTGFERLRDELVKSANKPHFPCSPHTIPTPEQIRARKKWQINKNE